MAYQVDWSLLGPPVNYGERFLQGVEAGRQMVQQRRQQNALSRWAQSPDDPTAVRELMAIDPKVGYPIYKDLRERERETQTRTLTAQAVGGDEAALAQLAGIDLDAWSKLDTRTKALAKERNDYIGQAALAVSQLPEEQRAAAWDDYVRQGVEMGFDDLAPYQGQYSPESLNAALARSGMVKQFLDTQRIQWHQVGERPSFATDAYGRPVGSANPYSAMTGTAADEIPVISDPERAKNLPPGSVFKTPDGRILRVPGGSAATPPSTFP